MSMLWLLLVLPALGALGLTIFNEFVWPRGRMGAHPNGSISVLIPARNEALNIEAAVRSVMSGTVKPDEVIVYDDGSTDSTPDILKRLSEEFRELRVENGIGLPPGWVGKPHACHRLAGFARGDRLLFLDADVRLHPEGLQRILSIFEDYGAKVVTAVPRQEMVTFPEKLVMPLLHMTYTSWLPMPLVWKTNDPRFLAANGQVLAFDRDAYDQVGGFEAIRKEVVDDMAICRIAKTKKLRVVFADGHFIATCRMYRNFREIWEGFSKNLYEGIGAHPIGLIFLVALYVGTFVAPYLGLVSFAWSETWGLAALAGVLANLSLRFVLSVRHGHPFVSTLLHPVAVLVLMAIAINSWWWNTKGAITWSGRVYQAKKSR